jgi:hypothetical protein
LKFLILNVTKDEGKFPMKTIITFLLLLLIPVSITYAGSLQGTVRDAQSLTPLENVIVTVHVVIPDSIPYPDTTDVNGVYSILDIVPGNEVYAVVAYKSGYVWSYARIDNLGSLDLVYDIFLTLETNVPPHGDDSTQVFGTIMTPSPGSGSLVPIPDAHVKLNSGSEDYDINADSFGNYSVTLPKGSYSMIVNATGYNDLSLTGVQAANAGASVNAILRVTTVDISNDHDLSSPRKFELMNAYPNPFNPSTVIRYEIPVRTAVTLKVFNILGNEIATLVSSIQEPGVQSVRFEPEDGLSSGVYFFRLQAGNLVETRKFILQR